MGWAIRTVDLQNNVVEDCKSEITKTPVYKIKKKLILQRYGITIKEIEK